MGIVLNGVIGIDIVNLILIKKKLLEKFCLNLVIFSDVFYS